MVCGRSSMSRHSTMRWSSSRSGSAASAALPVFRLPCRLREPAVSDSYCGKRALDLLASGAACALFAPAAAAVSVATWLEDGGPPLFLQDRIGQRRLPFTLVKFRSMREQRISHVGRWLRRTGIDEWPQFLNVCRGEMSLVGPRPLTATDVTRLGW